MAKGQARFRGAEVGRGDASTLGKMAILKESAQCADTQLINTGDNRTSTLPKSTSTLTLQAGGFLLVVALLCPVRTFGSISGLY